MTFKNEISFGTILQTSSILITILGVYVKLQQTIAIHTVEIRALENHLRVVELSNQANIDSIMKLNESQTRILVSLERTTTLLGTMINKSNNSQNK